MAARHAEAPERRGILTGQSLPSAGLIRFVRGPDGALVPDVAAKLPGRGFWLEPDRAALETALAKGRLPGLVARSLKQAVRAEDVPADLPDLIDRLLERRCLDRLGLERGAGRLVTGFEAVRDKLRSGNTAVLIIASDAADDGRDKLVRLAGPEITIIELFDRTQLSLALGRENVVHAALDLSGGARRLLTDARRLASFRGRSVGRGTEIRGGANRREQHEE